MTLKDFKNFLALTVAALMLVVIKWPSLIQYWQQSRHIFLSVQAEPIANRFLLNRVSTFNTEELFKEPSQRLVFASQILLSGSNAIPKPAPIIGKKMVAAVCPPAPKKDLICSNGKEEIKESPDTNKNSSTATPTSITNKVNSEPLKNITPANDAKKSAAAAAITLGDKLCSIASGEKLLLIGDSMMQGVAPFISTVMRRKFGIDSLDLGTKSTGLTYPSFFDWPAHVDDAFSKEHFAALIVFLGANDTWDMIQNNHYVKFGSDPWRQSYAERVERILTAAEKQDTKVVWLSAPPMGREDLTDRIGVLNEVIAAVVNKHRSSTRFVTTAEALTSDGKTFTKFIDVPQRGSVMVRTDDGVHFTPFGEELLAKLVISQFSLKQTDQSLSSNP